MQKINFLVTGLAALVPVLLGFIWYRPGVFGRTWMRASGLREEDVKKARAPLMLGLTLLFSFMIAFILNPVVIHQFHYYSILANEPGIKDPATPVGAYAQNFMTRYGGNFRTFKHGALHGFIMALFLVMPVIAILALFERKKFRYITVHAGYWLVSITLMGGIICQWT